MPPSFACFKFKLLLFCRLFLCATFPYFEWNWISNLLFCCCCCLGRERICRHFGSQLWNCNCFLWQWFIFEFLIETETLSDCFFIVWFRFWIWKAHVKLVRLCFLCIHLLEISFSNSIWYNIQHLAVRPKQINKIK